MVNVSKIKEGIVIDHIRAGHGYKIFQQLGLDRLEDVVVLMRNVDSEKMGHKDLIKIESNLDINLTCWVSSTRARRFPTSKTANGSKKSASRRRRRSRES